MAILYVLQTGQTIWEAEDRIESGAGAPLTEAGLRDVTVVAADLAGRSIESVYACAGEAEHQTAEVLARALQAKLRKAEALRELDFGLWQGLTVEEVRRRHPSLWRQWEERPASVRPPGGETLEEAGQRLRKGMREIVKRHKNGTALLVVRPIMRGLLRCLLEHVDLEDFLPCADAAVSWDMYEIDSKAL